MGCVPEINRSFFYDRAVPFFNTLVRRELLNSKPRTLIGLKELETSLYRVVQMRVDILNRLGVAHECDEHTEYRG